MPTTAHAELRAIYDETLELRRKLHSAGCAERLGTILRLLEQAAALAECDQHARSDWYVGRAAAAAVQLEEWVRLGEIARELRQRCTTRPR